MKRGLIAIGMMAATVLASAQASADLIIHEGFNYADGATSADPDGGANGGNGLPASGVATPSTGLRGNWGATTVVTNDGLTYASGANQLASAGNAATHNGTNFGPAVNVYRFLTPDPFLSYRRSANNANNFGAASATLYFSALMQVPTGTTVDSNYSSRLVWGGGQNLFIGASNGTGKWNVADGTGGLANSSVNVVAGETVLLVGEMTYSATGFSDVFKLWVNPTLGQALPATPSATLNSGATNSYQLGSLGLRTSAANNLIVDELRLGTMAADVMPVAPVPEPTSVVALLAVGGLGLMARRRQASLIGVLR